MGYLFDKPLYVRGGIASGMAMNDYADKKQKEQGLAAGLQEYLGASDEGQKDEALKNIAQYSPETAMDIYNSSRMTPYQEEMINLAKQRMANSGAGESQDTNAQRNVASMIEAGYSPQEAWAMYYGGNNPTLNMDMLGKKGQEAADKKIGEYVADEQIAQQQMKTLKPKAENALRRAKESLADGTGLGQFGGWGWTTGNGGKNRANIKNAQAQINTTMRGLLKQMGVGSTELNSAAEAEAYRYMISPDMPIEQQEQVLKNFREDYMSGNLARDLAETYGNKQAETIDINDPRVQEALANGYSIEEIKAYLRK